MDIPEKLRIIDEIIDGVKVSIIKKVKDMPEEWDSMELRWYISEIFKKATTQYTFNMDEYKRYRKYQNTAIVKGL